MPIRQSVLLTPPAVGKMYAASLAKAAPFAVILCLLPFSLIIAGSTSILVPFYSHSHSHSFLFFLCVFYSSFLERDIISLLSTHIPCSHLFLACARIKISAICNTHIHTFPLASEYLFSFASAFHPECGFCPFWLRLCSELVVDSNVNGVVLIAAGWSWRYVPTYCSVHSILRQTPVLWIPYYSNYYFYLCL